MVLSLQRAWRSKEVIIALTFLFSLSLGDELNPNAVNADTGNDDTDAENVEDEPTYVILDEMKTFHRQFRIILEAGSNENCFTAEVEPNQHLKVEYSVRSGRPFMTSHLLGVFDDSKYKPY